MPENPVIHALGQQVRSHGSSPLLTWYEPASGARTELSVKTLANWVDKTANLLGDLGLTGTIAGEVSLSHPGHWMSLIWPLAAWQSGCEYAAIDRTPECEAVVVGPDSAHGDPRMVTIACSLHPLGLGLGDLPESVIDFTTEALAQPDQHLAASVSGAEVAWRDHQTVQSHAETGASAPQAGRVLVRPSGPARTLQDALIGPILGGGSAVVVDGTVDPETLARIATSERAHDLTGLA